MSVTVRAPLWSIKGVYTCPPQARATTQPESEKYSLTERKGLSSDIVPDGWSLGFAAVFIYLCEGEWAFCEAGQRTETNTTVSFSGERDC